MKSKVAFQNFNDEQELEGSIKSTAIAYQNQQIASLTGFKYFLKAVGKTTTAMESA